MILYTLSCAAQVMIKSSSKIEICSPEIGKNSKPTKFTNYYSIEENFYWRKKCKEISLDEQEQLKNLFTQKNSYTFLSIYKREHFVGLRFWGFDFDPTFSASRNSSSTFNKFNKIRMGLSFMVEIDSRYPMSPISDSYYFIDFEYYFNYLHLPATSRGDRNMNSRKNSFMLSILATPTQRFYAFMKYKPVGNTWVGFYFKQNRHAFYYDVHAPKVGVLLEIQTNEDGYKNSITKSSKDQYKGLTVIGGIDLNIKTNMLSVNFGIQYDFRNH